MMPDKGLIVEIFNVGTSSCASSISIRCVYWWCWIVIQERSSVVQNPGFFPSFGKGMILWLRVSCALPRACCVSMSNLHVLRFSKRGLRISYFVSV